MDNAIVTKNSFNGKYIVVWFTWTTISWKRLTCRMSWYEVSRETLSFLKHYRRLSSFALLRHELDEYIFFIKVNLCLARRRYKNLDAAAPSPPPHPTEHACFVNMPEMINLSVQFLLIPNVWKNENWHNSRYTNVVFQKKLTLAERE